MAPVRTLVAAVAVAVAAVAAVAASAPLGARQATTSPQDETILQYLQADERFTKLVELLESANLTAPLNATAAGHANYTLFAPTNQAFDAFNNATVLAENFTVAAVLEYHALNYIFGSQNLSQLCFLGNDTELNLCELRNQQNTTVALQTLYLEPELNGQPQRLIVFTNDSTTLQKANNATITEPDIQVANGLIHIVNAVLVPPPNATVVLTEGAELDLLPISTEFMDILQMDQQNVSALLNDQATVLFVPWVNATANNATVACVLDFVRSKGNDTLTRQFVDFHIGQSVVYVSDLLYGNFSNTTDGQQTLPGFVPGANITAPLQRNTTVATLASAKVNVTAYLETGQAFVTSGSDFNVSIVNHTLWYDIPTRNGVIQFIDGILVPSTFLVTNNISCSSH